MIKRFFLLAFILGIAFFANAQQQPSKEELQKQQKELQEEINELNRTLSEIKKNKKFSLKEFAMYQRKIAVREQLVSNINKNLRRLEDQIYLNQVEIYRLKKELDTLKMQYAQSIVFAYKNRSSNEYLNFIFSSTSFNDALTRIQFLKSYRLYRETQAQTILKTQNLLQSKIGTLNDNRTEMNQTLQVQSSQLNELEQDKKQKEQEVKNLKSQEKEVSVLLKKREKQRQDLNRAINAAIKRELAEAKRKEKEEQDRKARLAKEKSTEEQKKTQPLTSKPTNKPSTETKPTVNSTPVTEGMSTKKTTRDYNTFESTPEGLQQSINFESERGRLPWPVSSGMVSGHFGRQQLGTNMWVNNDGIFIATEVGSNVKCVADGEVITIMDFGEYQAVMIRHGRYFTIYNKLSSVSVSKGQKVNAGTPVGKAGTDFNGEGEIEFRVMNGESHYADPEKWLKHK